VSGSSPAPRLPVIDVAVVGSFMMDLVAAAPRRPEPGETLRGTSFDEHLGGKGFNQAVAAARIGARTAMVGRLGDDRYGEEFLSFLDHAGINRDHVAVQALAGTGIGLPVVLPDGSNSIIIVPRANDAFTVQDVVAAGQLIRRSRVVLAQLELPLEPTLEALQIGCDGRAITVLNPAPYHEDVAQFAGRVDIVVPNQLEAERMTGLDCSGPGALGAAEYLAREFAARAAVITLGDLGAVAAIRRQSGAIDTVSIPAHVVDAVDTVGAGDAFCGALAAQLALGRDVPSAVSMANAAAALTTTRRGSAASTPTIGETEAFIGQLLRNSLAPGT